VLQDISMDECLKLIEENPVFTPWWWSLNSYTSVTKIYFIRDAQL
jgi:hypothetical protein